MKEVRREFELGRVSNLIERSVHRHTRRYRVKFLTVSISTQKDTILFLEDILLYPLGLKRIILKPEK